VIPGNGAIQGQYIDGTLTMAGDEIVIGQCLRMEKGLTIKQAIIFASEAVDKRIVPTIPTLAY
jgi:hypothetical protein